jgi:hypothetical protein
MAIACRYLAALLITGAAVSIAVAPIATADSGVLPQPGSENASDTINDLTGQGYDVQINWVNGIPKVDLSQCWVNGINTAASTGGGLRTAYVDIECPK